MKEGIKILFVEDDLNLGYLLTDFLEANGFEVKLFRDGISGLNSFGNKKYDFCLLDVMLPKLDGFTLAGKIRKINKQIPIILLTAKAMKEDKLKGYSLGIDDYITKPFDEDELLCKIKAILMRVRTTSVENECKSFYIGKYFFDYPDQLLSFNDFSKRLTTKETEILRILSENKNKIVKRNDILLKVWGNNDYFTGRSLDVFITKLRKYLLKDKNIKIETIPTVGYILSDKKESLH